MDAFIASLDARVPELVLRYGVPSVSVSVVHHGRTFTRSWGVADLQSGRPPADATLYNVASISKVVTAWAVMRLVESGRVELDAPISRYVSRFKLPPSPLNDGVTVRRLLGHTGGLSMPAVPWYGPEDAIPTLADMLSRPPEPLRLIGPPGGAHRYSGGGYALLQLLIEEVAGEPYEVHVEKHVIRPLGMNDSTFDVKAPNRDRATPYDSALRRLSHYRFAATGAAGLYTTAADLARFAVAGLRPDPGAGILRPSTVAAMETLQEADEKDPFGHGLGYAVVPLPSGGRLVGHSGSNEGWTSNLSMVPESGDALVVLVNRSDAFPVYRDLLCDWVEAASGGRWPEFCERKIVSWASDDEAFVDRLFASTTSADPAAAVLVATTNGVVYRKAVGTRDLGEAAPATPETPFYTASLAKSMTAAVALGLVAQGRWSLDDAIGTFVPGLPEYVRGVTIDQLLSHTAGVPEYHGLIEWGRYDGMDNRKAIALLARRGALDFPAGTAYGYSNTGYLLVASAIERLAGREYAAVLRQAVLDPLGMRFTTVDDGRQPPPEARALGYQRDGARTVLSDYHTVTIGGQAFPLRSSTVGAGGMYSTLDDLYALERAFRGDRLLPLALGVMATSPRTIVGRELEVPGVVGHGFGWFVSRWSGRNVVWNTGDFAGHHTALLRVPDQDLVVIVLSSAAERSAIELARTIVERLLAPRGSVPVPEERTR